MPACLEVTTHRSTPPRKNATPCSVGLLGGSWVLQATIFRGLLGTVVYNWGYKYPEHWGTYNHNSRRLLCTVIVGAISTLNLQVEL